MEKPVTKNLKKTKITGALAFGSLFLMILLSCTGYSNKKKALQLAESELEQSYYQEIDLRISQKQNLKKSYAEALVSKSQIEVRDVKDFGQRKVAIVKIKKVPKNIREPLMDIISKIDESKESAFNASNAIQLIYQELKVPSDKFDESQLEIPISP